MSACLRAGFANCMKKMHAAFAISKNTPKISYASRFHSVRYNQQQRLYVRYSHSHNHTLETGRTLTPAGSAKGVEESSDTGSSIDLNSVTDWKKIIVVHPASHSIYSDNIFEETKALASSLSDWEVAWSHLMRLRSTNPALYLGKGWVERIQQVTALLAQRTALLMSGANNNPSKNPHHLRLRNRRLPTEPIHIVVFIDAFLSAVQQRNLEKALQYDELAHPLPPASPTIQISVWDRFALILEIFSERAQTKEAKLQVDLARVAFEKSRLVRDSSGRFGLPSGGEGKQVVSAKGQGGHGFVGGGGEKEIEVEHRLLADREARLRHELEDVKRTRAVQRGKRVHPIVAICGYTNAGKSALLRML